MFEGKDALGEAILNKKKGFAIKISVIPEGEEVEAPEVEEPEMEEAPEMMAKPPVDQKQMIKEELEGSGFPLAAKMKKMKK